MRNLLALIGLVVVVFLGLGWYLGWYQLHWSTNSDGKTDVNLSLNNGKIVGDLKTAKDKASQFLDSKLEQPAESNKNFVGPTLPGDWTPATGSNIRPPAGLPAPGTR